MECTRAEHHPENVSERVDYGMGSEECLKLWMELEAKCGQETRREVVDENKRGGARDEPSTSLGGLQECTTRDKEDWAPAAAVTLLEAYEERLSEGNAGNLKTKDWDKVASSVNRHLDEKSNVKKSLKQCKRQVYALRRWYKSVVSKQVTYRPDESEDCLLCVLDGVMVPCPCQAGIPGGIDAGERMSMPTSSSFDEEEEEEEEEEQIQVTTAVRTKQGRGFQATASLEEPRKRIRSAGTGTANCKEGQEDDRKCGAPTKKPCKTRDAIAQGDLVSNALSAFVEILARVEQSKMEIMKDLDIRRTELQVRLAHLKPYPQGQEEPSPQPALMTLL